MRHIPHEVKEADSDIAWHEVRGMGNEIIHAYVQVDDKILWTAIQVDLVDLMPMLIQLKADS